MLPAVILAFLLAPALFAQYCSSRGFDQAEVERIKTGMRSCMSSEQNARFLAQEKVEIKDLTPFHNWLNRRFGQAVAEAPQKAPLLRFGRELQHERREDDRSRSFRAVRIDVQLGETIDDAGKCAAIYLSRSSLGMAKGSYSGKPIGDWTARGVSEPGEFLVFGSRNAFVRMRCGPKVEFTKPEGKRRFPEDRRRIKKCEDLARDIDAQLRGLP